MRERPAHCVIVRLMTSPSAQQPSRQPDPAHQSLLAWLDHADPATPALLAQRLVPAPHPMDDGVRGCGIALVDADLFVDRLPQALLPASVARAVRQRRRTFVAGRLCAEWLLRQAGRVEPAAIAIGADGQPVWPVGWRGSITHDDQHAYVVLGRGGDGADGADDSDGGIGIDTEQRVDEDGLRSIAAMCCTAAERQRWLGGTNDRLTATLLFCAKEALYKAIHPQVRRFVEFTEVQVASIDWSRGELAFEPPGPVELRLPVSRTRCRFVVTAQQVHVSVCGSPARL